MYEAGGGSGRRTRGALAGWAVLIAGCFAVGAVLHALGVLRIDHLPPLHAHFRVLTVTLLPVVAFAVVAVRKLPGWVRQGGFGRALLVAYGCALAWTILLAISADGLAAPFTHREEYLAVLPAVGHDPLGWLVEASRSGCRSIRRTCGGIRRCRCSWCGRSLLWVWAGRCGRRSW